MILYNTRNPSQRVHFGEALFRGLADANGLFMPEHLPVLPRTFFEELPGLPVSEIAFRFLRTLLGTEVPDPILQPLCADAFSFPVPLVRLNDTTWMLELFHGPSLAFKDFGARFMSRMMGWYNQKQGKNLHILVATSGDTGGAVAMGFLGVPGIEVTILYPKGRVSDWQERQLTCLGQNIRALEVEGTFDDCQFLVKEAFQDAELRDRLGLSSANSINIGRLLPQAVYYLSAWADLQGLVPGSRPVFSVPSGNFGNLCAGVFAAATGLPVTGFEAAVNANRVFPDYLATGHFQPKPALATLSNAMDVGNPSNFARLAELYPDAIQMGRHIRSHSFSDAETTIALHRLLREYHYLSEPHAAVGFLGMEAYRKETWFSGPGIVLGTAHPAKFLPVLPDEIRSKVVIPPSLLALKDRPSQKQSLPVDFASLKKVLLAPR